MVNGLDAASRPSIWQDIRARSSIDSNFLQTQPLGNYCSTNLRTAVSYQYMTVFKDQPTDIWMIDPSVATWMFDPELLAYADRYYVKSSFMDEEDLCCSAGPTCKHQCSPAWYTTDDVPADGLTLISSADVDCINDALTQKNLCYVDIASAVPQWVDHLDACLATFHRAQEVCPALAGRSQTYA